MRQHPRRAGSGDRLTRCGCASTSPTTGPASTAGPGSTACAPCRETSSRRSTPCCGAGHGADRRRPHRHRSARARPGRPRRPRPGRPVAAAAGRSPEPRRDALARRLNGVLDPDVRIHRVSEAPDGFDARFSALWRRYAYRVADRPRARGPADARARARLAAAAGPGRDERGAQRLLGEHDFAAFCRKREGATTIRTLLDLRWDREPTACAWRPCGPTRSATPWCARWWAACSRSGRAGSEPEWAAQVLAARAARPGGDGRCRAHGLTLEEVAYPPDARCCARASAGRADTQPAGD